MYQKLNDYDVTLETLNSINKNLDFVKKTSSEKSCFLGFDGYVDSLYSVVKSRKSATEWKNMESMRDFGELLVKVAGSSANIERILKKKIFGGFAPNTARALSTLGLKIYLIASLGIPHLHKHFQPQPLIEPHSISNPGQTLGLEFNDGKVMITDFEPILKIDWHTITDKIRIDQLIDMINKSDMIGFGHWALIPNLNNIWKHFLIDLFPSITKIKDKLFFVDIADIRKRSKQDIKDLLKILKNIDEQIPVMLSANDQEAIELSRALDKVKIINSKKKNYADFIDGGKEINQIANLSYLVCHSPHFATISTRDNHYWITEGFTSKPKYTVAAGDYFHSGTALGLVCGLSPPESVLLGNALTAIFVRTGSPPDFRDLTEFLIRYLEFIENDIPYFP
jgi:sugar/nucleoside kinase (ribokinase family)